MKKIYKSILKYKYIIVFIILVILVRIVNNIYLFDYKYSSQKDSSSIDLFILNEEKQTEKYISYLVKIKEEDKYTDKFILNLYVDKDITTKVKKDEFYRKYSGLKYGDIVNVKGKIIIPKTLNNLYEFDYKNYLNSKGIVGSIITYDLNITNKFKNSILTYIYLFKETLERNIDSKLPILEANLFKSMIYGNDINLDENLKENFNELGLSHLLAVSGSNVGIIVLALTFVYKKIKLNNIISFIINVIFLFVFSAISNFEISVLRASIVSIIVIFSSLLSHKINKIFVAILAAIILIIHNPFVVFSISFILSFSAFFGILLFNNRIYSFFNIYIIKIIKYDNILKIRSNRSSLKMYILYKTLKLISKILSLYFSVQIVIIPIQIYFFNSFYVISILSNLVIYIFSSIQLILGFLFILLGYIPYISDILSNLNYLSLWSIIKIVNALVKFNVFEISLPTPDKLTIICYYTSVLLIFYGYRINYHLKYIFKNINTNIIIKLIGVICIIYILYFNIYTTFFLSFVYYFNVEQGNMAIVKSGTESILVDMGTTGSVNIGNILEGFLNSYNIDKIDFFLVTHFHSDHVNGLFKLEEKFEKEEMKIESVIYSIPKYEDKVSQNIFSEQNISYLEFENFLNKFKIKQLIVERFDKIRINKNTVINILSPKDKEIIKSKDIVNANCIITMISIKNSNYLFMGDSTIESEEVLLDDIYNLENSNEYLSKFKNIKALQVGHHGSNTSTSEYFLNNIKANIGIISSKKSVYGHPSLKVKDRLEKYNIKIHITEKSGGKLIK